jgi:ABC-type branched-subunit amino acid transport system substrate-binding protein
MEKSMPLQRRSFLAGLLASGATAAWAQSPTDRALRIGSSMPLTGPLAASAKLLVSGAQLCFDAVNKAGGVNGARIEFQVLDDGFDPARSAENCRQLVSEREVIALFANPGTAQVVAALPIAQKTGTPMFGPVTGSSALRKQKLQEVFHVRASFREELQHIVNHTRTVGIQRIGLFHTDDALGKSVRDELQEILAAAGSRLAAVSGVPFRDGNIAQAAKEIWQHQPQAVVLGAAGLNFGKFVAAYRALGGQAPQMYGLSVVDPAGLGDDSTGALRGVVLTQIMPSTRNTILPVVREYREALAKARGGAEPTVLELDSFVSAKILVEGLRRAGRGPSRSALITALEGLGRYDAGGYAVTYTRDNHNGSTFVDMAIVGANGKLQY